MTRSLGQLTLDLVAKTSSFTGPMDRASKQAERQFKQMERDGKAAAKSLGLITAAATAAAGAIYAYGKAGMNTIDANAKLARSLDGTLDGLRALKMAAEDNGLDGMEASLNRMNRRLGAVEMNGGPAAKTVERLGLNLKAMQDMDIDERLAYIADQIKATGMSSQEAARHLQQLGFEQRGAYELFMRGGDVIRAAREEMEAYGLSISMVDAAAIEDANTAISKLSLVSESAQNALAIRLAPALNDIADALNDITKAFHAGEYDTHIRVMQSVATTTATAGATYLAMRAAINLATIAQWKLNAAMRANPIGLIATGVAVAVTGLGALAAALDDSADRAARMEGRANELAASLQHMGETSIRTQLAAITLELAKMDGAMEALEESSSRRVRDNRILGGTIEDLRDNIEKTIAANRVDSEETEKLRTQKMALSQALDIVTGGSKGAAEGIREITIVSSNATREAERLEAAYESLLDRLYPIEASQRRFREEMELLDLAAQAGKVHDLADAQERLLKSFGSDLDWQSTYGFDGMGAGQNNETSYWDRWLEGAENAFTDFDQMAANTAESFQRGFGNAFESMIFDSQSLGDAVHGMADSMLRSVVNALGQMAAQWLAYQAVQLLVGRTTATQEGMRQSLFAQAKVFESGLNAFSSTAAIPVVGPFMAPGAMLTAMATTQPLANSVQSLAMAGMAHDGIDSIPREGTWLLDKGERVLNAPQASKLDHFLDQQQAQDRRRDGVTVNIIENPERAGQRETTVNADGREEESLFVADIYGDGPRSRAIQNAFGLQRRGR